MKAQEGCRVIALLILNLSARWGWKFNAMSRPLYFRETETISLVQEVGWAPGPVRKRMVFSRSDRSVHPIASRYTECAIPANNIKMDLKKCEVLWSGMEEPGLGEGTMVGSLDLLLPREGGREFSWPAEELLDFKLGCTPRIWPKYKTLVIRPSVIDYLPHDNML